MLHETPFLDLFQLDEYVNHPDISAANQYFAKCYKNLLDKKTGYSIQERPVLAYTKDGYNKVYSIQPLEGDLENVKSEKDVQHQQGTSGNCFAIGL